MLTHPSKARSQAMSALRRGSIGRAHSAGGAVVIGRSISQHDAHVRGANHAYKGASHRFGFVDTGSGHCYRPAAARASSSMAEQLTLNQRVEGSSPSRLTTSLDRRRPGSGRSLPARPRGPIGTRRGSVLLRRVAPNARRWPGAVGGGQQRGAVMRGPDRGHRHGPEGDADDAFSIPARHRSHRARGAGRPVLSRCPGDDRARRRDPDLRDQRADLRHRDGNRRRSADRSGAGVCVDRVLSRRRNVSTRVRGCRVQLDDARDLACPSRRSPGARPGGRPRAWPVRR